MNIFTFSHASCKDSINHTKLTDLIKVNLSALFRMEKHLWLSFEKKYLWRLWVNIKSSNQCTSIKNCVLRINFACFMLSPCGANLYNSENTISAMSLRSVGMIACPTGKILDCANHLKNAKSFFAFEFSLCILPAIQRLVMSKSIQRNEFSSPL